MISSDMREYVSGGGYERDKLQQRIIEGLKKLKRDWEEDTLENHKGPALRAIDEAIEIARRA